MATKEQQVIVMTNEDGTECAWCNKHQGRPQGSGSHGICEIHAELQYARYIISKMPSETDDKCIRLKGGK